MSERAPAPPPFDPDALSEALHTAAHPTDDLAFGTGQRYDLPAGHLRLEVFPERRLNRITTRTARVELSGTPPPQVVNGQVVINQESGQEGTSLSVSSEGTMVFGYVHRPAAPPEEPVTAPEGPQEPSRAAPTASDTASVDGAPPVADPTPPTPIRPPADTRRRPGATGSPPNTPSLPQRKRHPPVVLTPLTHQRESSSPGCS